MRISEAKGPPAASKLLAHIRELDVSIPKWCEEKGLDRLKVQKAINGQFVRVDAGFAFAIEKATDGAVPAKDWVS